MELSSSTPSAFLSLRNRSPEPIRLQITVRSWDQSATGDIVTRPTNDVICFPLSVNLAPNESRNLRVGRQVPPGEVEKTYRVFARELPELKKKGDAPQGIRVLTQIGVPIFIPPMKVQRAAAIQDAMVKDGTLSFRIRNTGTVHYLPTTIHVRGAGPDGQIVYNDKVAGWYVLARGDRVFTHKIPADVCAKLRSLEIESISNQLKLKAQVAVGR